LKQSAERKFREPFARKNTDKMEGIELLYKHDHLEEVRLKPNAAT
jgi:hypothetical protein